MKRIIEEILQAEEKVGAALRQAREKASEILRSAEKEISEKMGNAREKAHEIMQATVEDAKKEAERLREERLEQMNREKSALLSSKTDASDALVDDICKIILTTEHQRDSR